MTVAKNDVHISLGMPNAMVTSIDRIANALGRSRDEVIRGAVADYLSGDGADILDDAEGLDQLDSGLATDAETVLREARTIVAMAEKRNAAKAG